MLNDLAEVMKVVEAKLFAEMGQPLAITVFSNDGYPGKPLKVIDTLRCALMKHCSLL